MKILGVLVQQEPFSEPQLDEEIYASDQIFMLHTSNVKVLVEFCKKLNEDFEIIYIHQYEDVFTIGVKERK